MLASCLPELAPEHQHSKSCVVVTLAGRASIPANLLTRWTAAGWDRSTAVRPGVPAYPVARWLRDLHRVTI